MATGKLPSSSIVRLPGGRLQARPDLTLAEWALLCRADGRRPLAALANRSGRGHNEAIALVEGLLAAGLLELAGSAEAGPDAPAEQAGAAEAEPDVADEGEPLVAAAGEAGAEAASPGQERIDPVSLLRELAADTAGGAVAADERQVQEDHGLAELAARLAGGRQQAEQADPEVGEDEPPGGDEPARAPGRGTDQADILREFASLAMGGESSGDQGTPPQPDDESADDERGRGRFGFRRGQRR